MTLDVQHGGGRVAVGRDIRTKPAVVYLAAYLDSQASVSSTSYMWGSLRVFALIAPRFSLLHHTVILTIPVLSIIVISFIDEYCLSFYKDAYKLRAVFHANRGSSKVNLPGKLKVDCSSCMDFVKWGRD